MSPSADRTSAPRLPDRLRAAWRQAEPWLTAVVALAVAGLALSWRLDALPSATVDRDWAWFLRVARQQAWGQAWGGPSMFMYPSQAPLAFGLLARLLGSGGAALAAWTALAALAAPLTLLATRRVAGLPAGLLAALTLMVSASQAWIGVGLKSPYLISLAASALALGLVSRATWAPGWAAFWATALVALHVGVAPGAALGVLFALGAAWRLPPGRPRRLGLGGWAVGATLIPAHLVWVDLRRLTADARLHLERGGILDTVDPALHAQRLEQGLSLRMEHAELLLGCGLLAGLLFGVWLWRARPEPEEPWRAQGLASARVAAVGLAALSPYLYQMRALDYLEVHHLPGVVPLLLVGLAGLTRAAAPPGFGGLGAAAAALALVPWYLDSGGMSGALHGVVEGRHPVAHARALEGAIRAASPGQDPVVIGWVERGASEDRATFTRTVAELVQVGPWREGLPPTCFVLSDTPEAGFIDEDLALLAHPEGSAWWLLEDPGCRATLDVGVDLCGVAREKVLVLRDDFGQLCCAPPVEWRLLPSCYG